MKVTTNFKAEPSDKEDKIFDSILKFRSISKNNKKDFLNPPSPTLPLLISKLSLDEKELSGAVALAREHLAKNVNPSSSYYFVNVCVLSSCCYWHMFFVTHPCDSINGITTCSNTSQTMKKHYEPIGKTRWHALLLFVYTHITPLPVQSPSAGKARWGSLKCLKTYFSSDSRLFFLKT